MSPPIDPARVEIMTYAAYDAIGAVRFSTLKELRKSPLHYQHRLRNAKADASFLALGRATHTAVLEPDRFALDMAVYTESKSKGEGARKNWQAFQAANLGRTVLSADEYSTCCAMRDAARAHPGAGPYLAHGTAEQTITWIDEPSGLRCKARLDWVSTSRPAIVDLKTARDVTPRRFASAAAGLLYHAQMAFYCMGWRAVTGADLAPVLIAVESEAPHDVVCYRLDEEAQDEGRVIVRDLLDELAERQRTGCWPGVDRGVEQILSLPRWALPYDAGDDLPMTFGKGATP